MLREVARIEAVLLIHLVVREVLYAGASAKVGEAVEPNVVLVEKAVITTPQTVTENGNGFVL
jgi:hypothetical protein